jgi:DNA polymerase III subunit alpha
MKRYLKELKPSAFEDIIAMVALYRPGPMQWIDDFIARKHGVKSTEYLHPAMEPAIKNTYGVIVYQEQVMQISKDLCGFTGGQADTLRKAIGKKKPEELAKMKTDFIEGAIKTVGVDRKLMEKFWSQLEAFAAYCFPKAHATCYAVVAYQTAYLKAHYPTAFMAAVMTSDYDNIDRLAIEIAECQHMNIDVQQPDVNESFVNFAIVPGDKPTIRFGMNAIKNVGTGAVEEIVRARKAGGLFANLEDFLTRVNVRIVNRKALESLIKAGAFDRFGDRSVLLHNLDGVLAYANRVQKQASNGQIDLFGAATSDIIPQFHLVLDRPSVLHNERERLAWERELLGLYLSQHPLKNFEGYLAKHVTAITNIQDKKDGETVTIGGVISTAREIMTKNGQKMAFIKLEDSTSEIEVVAFPNTYKNYAEFLQRDKVVKLKGKISQRGSGGSRSGSLSVIIDQVEEISLDKIPVNDDILMSNDLTATSSDKPTSHARLETADQTAPERVYIRLESGEDHSLLQSLKLAIDDFHGETEVVLVLGADKQKQAIKLPTRIDTGSEALTRLATVVGADNVKLQ